MKQFPLRFYAFYLALLLGGTLLPAQEQSILTAYERNFLRASLPAKVSILYDARTDDRAEEFIGGLYEFALDFSIQNMDILRDDPDFIALTALAAQGVGLSDRRESVANLWTVFSSFRDTVIRVEAVNSLALLAPGDPLMTERLSQFMADQNSLHRSGLTVDYITLSACTAALGAVAGPAAIPVLFAVMVAGYPDPLTDDAAAALEALPDQDAYRRYLGEIIRRSPPEEKAAAFEAGLRNPGFGDADKGELAETALETALEAAEAGDLTELRYAAVRTLGELRWVRAAPLVMRNYTLLYQDYILGAPPERLLEAITALGAMESAEAARMLSLQLGRLNDRMETSGQWDEGLILCLINALGELGHRIAFDYLTYVAYLSYPESVQDAAREALGRLQW
jgi:hypothetical protein